MKDVLIATTRCDVAAKRESFIAYHATVNVGNVAPLCAVSLPPRAPVPRTPRPLIRIPLSCCDRA